MDSCGCDGYASPIDDRIARQDWESYRADGPDRTTRMLLDMIRPTLAGGETVLDVGGGVGVIDHELLRAGAGSAVLVEASPAYLGVALDAAEGSGLLDRMRIVPGDVVRVAGSIDSADGLGRADVVTLDKVVCCYPDAEALVGVTAARATKLYGLVLPRDRWYVRWSLRADALRWWLKRSAYRPQVHSNVHIDDLVASAGLRRTAEAFTVFWRVVVYERDPAPAR